MARHRVTILPERLHFTGEAGESLAAVMGESGILVNFPCGGQGRCGKCVVRVTKGAADPTPEERKFLSQAALAEGMRLACRLIVAGDMTIEIPPGSRVAGTGKGWEEVRVLSKSSGPFGPLFLAVDLGTTSIAAALTDRTTQEVLALGSVLNPQASFGADVISRINAVIADNKALARQQALAAGAIYDLTVKLTAGIGTTTAAIEGMTLAGNPTMEHLFLGIDPSPIAFAPFTPSFRGAQEAAAEDLGISLAPRARAWVFPVLSGYVGGDTLAFIWSAKIHESDEAILGIDIGTNGEIVLGNRRRLLSCSTAAGPAFEGAHIRDGMRADVGAIEGVVIDNDTVKISVKGNGRPRGICGSGLIDAVAQMKKSHLIDPKGRIVDNSTSPHLRDRVRKSDGVTEFALFADKKTTVGITQKDIREIQLAKGAIHSGVRILLDEMGIGWGDIDRVLIAGAFGNYLKRTSIVGVGLLPESLLDKIAFVGDAALTGATDAALSDRARTQIEGLADRVHYIELSSDKRFADLFINSLSFEESKP